MKFYSYSKQGIIKRNKLAKCFLQLDQSSLVEFINEFNTSFFDAKGEKFLMEAEIASFQSIPVTSQPFNNDFYSSEQFFKFRELYESGTLDNKIVVLDESLTSKKSSLVEMVKCELEEMRKKKENKMKIKNNKYKQKSKNWKGKKTDNQGFRQPKD